MSKEKATCILFGAILSKILPTTSKLSKPDDCIEQTAFTQPRSEKRQNKIIVSVCIIFLLPRYSVLGNNILNVETKYKFLFTCIKQL